MERKTSRFAATIGWLACAAVANAQTPAGPEFQVNVHTLSIQNWR